jgi:hydrogenase/urease accessory protein HupE
MRQTAERLRGILVRRAVAATGFVAILAMAALATRSEAHVFERTATTFRIDAARNFDVTLKLDLDALALGVDPAIEAEVNAQTLLALSEADFRKADEGLRAMLSRRLRIRADGKALPFEISFPEMAPRAERVGVEVFGLLLRLRGAVPAGAKEVQFFASRGLPAIELTFADEGTGRREFHICLQGEECPQIPLTPGEARTRLFDFVIIGFKHIVPLGLDHILFVLALFLGGRDPKTLFVQTAAFTIAHSLTLALSTFGVLSLPSSVVEPLIALSIAVVGFENLVRPAGVSRMRAAVVFCFGLLHGLGFAGILAETPMAEGQKLAALVLFNVGVELGQIAVLLAAFLLSLPVQNEEHYRRFVQHPLSVVLVVVGAAWAAARVAS